MKNCLGSLLFLLGAAIGCGSGASPECSMDTDCPAGNVCSSEVCVPGCSAEQGCPAPESCCNGTCVDTSFDSQNCKTCGNVCMATEVCGPTSCLGLAFGSMCDFPTIGALQGGTVQDDMAGLAARDALAIACTSSTVEVLSQVSDVVANQDTGQPLTGPSVLLTVWGGSFRRPVIEFFEDNNLTPLVFTSTDGGARFEITNAATGALYVDEAFADVGASHDIFTLQFMHDAGTGSVILNASGSRTSGTSAAAVFLENVVLPGIGTDTNGWYVVDWTDDDGTSGPSVGDTFTVVASGI